MNVRGDPLATIYEAIAVTIFQNLKFNNIALFFLIVFIFCFRFMMHVMVSYILFANFKYLIKYLYQWFSTRGDMSPLGDVDPV